MQGKFYTGPLLRGRSLNFYEVVVPQFLWAHIGTENYNIKRREECQCRASFTLHGKLTREPTVV